MSRSNPHEGSPNPSTRWHEWNGEAGNVRYYDKDAKKSVALDLPFTFMLLDQLGGVGGWHDPSSSGIYSNEVRDTSQDVLLVKSFKGGILAEGIYKDIKDSIKAKGGQFVANCYIAYKLNGGLAIGSLKFKGAALGAWMEFTKAHRADLYTGAIVIHGFTEGKKGRITFRMPTMKAIDVSEDSNTAAKALDAQLQEWLTGYLKRNKREQVEHVGAVAEDAGPQEEYGAPAYADEEPQW